METLYILEYSSIIPRGTIFPSEYFTFLCDLKEIEGENYLKCKKFYVDKRLGYDTLKIIPSNGIVFKSELDRCKNITTFECRNANIRNSIIRKKVWEKYKAFENKEYIKAIEKLKTDYPELII